MDYQSQYLIQNVMNIIFDWILSQGKTYLNLLITVFMMVDEKFRNIQSKLIKYMNIKREQNAHVNNHLIGSLDNS